jgi:hypothetical protein
MSDRLCYVTAYLELGREKWTDFQRSFELYFQNFTPLVDLFNQEPRSTLHELVVFIDTIHYHRVKNYVGINPNITVVPIDENFMKNNIPAWERLDRETEIMNSEFYKTILAHRLKYPEHHNPKYTLINHAKIDFVNTAFLLSTCEYFCWVDFAYCNPQGVPETLIDINLLDKERINFVLINPFTERDRDVRYTILNAPERVGGGFFFGNRKMLVSYQQLYHKVHIWFQQQNLADDDQHLITQCYFPNKDFFKMEHLGGWFKALKHYQIQLKNKFNILQPIRLQKLNVLEIGAKNLESWKKYFPNSQIYGCAVNSNHSEQDRITTFAMDQINPASIQEQILDNETVYDVIIDNGIHYFPLNWCVLKQIFLRLSPEGIYIIDEIKDFDAEIYKDPFLDQIEYKVDKSFVARKKGFPIADL